ncbi:phospho-N-acetylmuramoyl-pentapeptide-transferase [Candidatus Gribaldobacteria bacterium]|nr:phospho-N-acetylmuramoyl-pentapeptide-transferase [Candidatus Gribaldobacteria bacterium]
MTSIIKIFFLCAFSAFLAVLWTPLLAKFLYKYKMWRKQARDKAMDGKGAPIFYSLHKDKEINTPRAAGVLIWLTTLFIISFFYLIDKYFPESFFSQLNFLSRSQTWLPLGVLIAASVLGLFDDVLQILSRGKYVAGGIRFTRRLAIVLLIALIGAWWFYFKLDFSTIHIPGNGSIELGLWYLPLFVLVMLACWSGNVIDGIDGLAGGGFAIMFGAFTIISYARAQYDLATFCAVIAGATLAFLWFNIPPARFYMGETGSIGLTATLAVVAFLTDSVLVLPIIGGLLVIESSSVIVQLISKRFFKKKIFLSAPIHHHLEAKGWGRDKIVMRAWILGMVFAIIGVAIRLLG